MSTPRYLPVDHHKAEEIKSLPPRSWGQPRQLSPMTQMLLAGRMVYVSDPKVKPASKTFERRGYKVNRRSGDGGYYYWLSAA